MNDSSRHLYTASGVDVAKGDELVSWLQGAKAPDATPRGEVVSGIGGFAALFRPRFTGLKDPLLVSSTDGVGTKVLLAAEQNRLEGLGIDLVGMCVNDLYTLGAEPLFFLDYYATGELSKTQFRTVLKGILAGLKQCGCALMGGETAELPGLYAKGHFDLAGFVLGVVDGEQRLGPERVVVGDTLIALKSSGFHSNGYSLIRKWLKEIPVDQNMMARILEPTRIYSLVPDWQVSGDLHAMAHITGGGISGNLPRVMPAGVVCEIERKKVPTPEWMLDLFEQHGASLDDVEGIFNLGCGMIVAAAKGSEDRLLSEAKARGFDGCVVGRVQTGAGPARVTYV